jgi:hypothetical protein
MSAFRRVRCCAAALLFLACRTPSARTDHPEVADRPAVIVNPTPESRAALETAVRSALHGVPVTLGEEALTGSNILVVDRLRRRGPNGLPLGGRDLGPGERFELVKNGPDCVLIRHRTRERFTLPGTQCEQIAAP